MLVTTTGVNAYSRSIANTSVDANIDVNVDADGERMIVYQSEVSSRSRRKGKISVLRDLDRTDLPSLTFSKCSGLATMLAWTMMWPEDILIRWG